MTPFTEGFRSETVVAVGAVERALELARRGVDAEDITLKGARDVMTATDVSIEDAVRGIVRDSLGFAVVGDPSTGEIDVAEGGRGAWALRDGLRRRLTASDESRTIVIEDGKSKGARREHAAQFTAGAIRADRWDVRSLGTTLALPYLAAGQISAYVVFWVSAIHAGAGSLLVTEAGGTLSDIDGHPWTIHSDSVVASATPDLHRELLDLIRASLIPLRTSAPPSPLCGGDGR